MGRRIWITTAFVLLLGLAWPACGKSSDSQPEQKPKSANVQPAAAKVVDQGSFAVFQNSQRVATEEFTIRQLPGSSVTSSHLRLSIANSGAQNATGTLEQSTELTLLANGEL